MKDAATVAEIAFQVASVAPRISALASASGLAVCRQRYTGRPDDPLLGPRSGMPRLHPHWNVQILLFFVQSLLPPLPSISIRSSGFSL